MSPLAQASRHLTTLTTLTKAGRIRPVGPVELGRTLRTLRRWGRTQAAAFSICALHWPDAPALIDEQGSLTFTEIQQRTSALARGLSTLGVAEGDLVALYCRNGRAFVEPVLACAKLGADVVFINNAMAAPQIKDVLEAQGPRALVYESEFQARAAEATAGRDMLLIRAGKPQDEATIRAGKQQDEVTIRTGGPQGESSEHRGATRGLSPSSLGPRSEAEGPQPDAQLEELIAHHDTSDLAPPEHEGRNIVLTSGTTGAPKGARRGRPSSLHPVADFLRVVPIKARDTSFIAAPLFHSLGYSGVEFAGTMGLTMVLARRFDPLDTLAQIERHQVRVLTVVPVMLKRIMDLPREQLDRFKCSSLEVVICSGSVLSYELASSFMDRFGPCIYNLYGATEIGWATIATPEDLLTAPGTIGRPVPGTRVAVLDENDRPVKMGDVGRLFAYNELIFEGYSGGTRERAMVEGMMSVGDLGHVDENGRVFVDSREDDMIVSGGENVYPSEVEELLNTHPEIDEAAVFGVDDEEFGQVLVAFVVRFPDSELNQEEVRRFAGERLARFKVPRHVEFLDEMPRSGTGKVVKRELLAIREERIRREGQSNKATSQPAAGERPGDAEERSGTAKEQTGAAGEPGDSKQPGGTRSSSGTKERAMDEERPTDG